MMVPVVIGALGSVTKKLKNFLEILDIKTLNVYLLQKTALLETVTTLRNILQLSECG